MRISYAQEGAKSLAKLAAVTAIALFATYCLSLWTTSASMARAGGHEEWSCYAAPYGSGGDRCSAANAQFLGVVHVTSVDHSGCADGLNGSGALVQSWLCTSGPGGEANASFGFSQPVRGIVRNNTTGAWNHLIGGQTW